MLRHTTLLKFLCLALIVSLCLMPMLKVYNLHVSVYDLGNFDFFFWNTVFDFDWSQLFFSHAQPLIPFEAIFYRIWTSPLLLVCLQSFFLLSNIYFVFFFSSKSVASPSILFIIAYLLYFPIWYNALFDFHMDHLAVPLLFLFYFGCFSRKWWISIIAALLLAMVKEPFALATIFCGIYLCMRWRKFGMGLFLCLFGGLYFYVTTSILIPQATVGIEGKLDLGVFSELGNSPFEILTYLFTYPVDILKEIFCNFGKMKYVLTIFGALLFIPFFSPMELLPIVPILGLSLLSPLDNYYGIGHQYTAGLIAPLIISFILGYSKAEYAFIRLTKNFFLEKKAKRTFVWGVLGWMVCVSVLLSPSPLSRLFLSNKVWSYGIEAYIPVERNNMIKDALKKYIPADPSVPVASQNTLTWGHLAHRNHYFAFPLGVTKHGVTPESVKNGFKEIWAEYVILDLKRPWFLIDKGCGWQTEEKVFLSEEEIKWLGLKENPGELKWVGCASQEFRNEFIDTIVETKKIYKRVFEQDGFMILRRAAD